MRNVTCDEGYKRLETVTNLLCHNGEWIYGDDASDDTETFGNNISRDQICQPICDTPCLNGGLCTAVNICVCTDLYRGSSCSCMVLDHVENGKLKER